MKREKLKQKKQNGKNKVHYYLCQVSCDKTKYVKIIKNSDKKKWLNSLIV